MRTVAIVGVGLIGGSFGLALRKAGFSGAIWGVSSASTLERAVNRGAVDRGIELAQAAQAELIYLAQPIQQILETIKALEGKIRPGVLVTDAGSTKRDILQAARLRLPGGCFLGGHPMAGKEARGIEAADSSLFEGRAYVLSPADPADLESEPALHFRSWLERIGARIVVIPADEHDRAAALASHLPQLVSSALALTACRYPEMAGPGLIEMTRLALSPYIIWRDILMTNRDNIDASLAAFIQQLEEFRARLGAGDLEREFDGASEQASKLRRL